MMEPAATRCWSGVDSFSIRERSLDSRIGLINWPTTFAFGSDTALVSEPSAR